MERNEPLHGLIKQCKAWNNLSCKYNNIYTLSGEWIQNIVGEGDGKCLQKYILWIKCKFMHKIIIRNTLVNGVEEDCPVNQQGFSPTLQQLLRVLWKKRVYKQCPTLYSNPNALRQRELSWPQLSQEMGEYHWAAEQPN